MIPLFKTGIYDNSQRTIQIGEKTRVFWVLESFRIDKNRKDFAIPIVKTSVRGRGAKVSLEFRAVRQKGSPYDQRAMCLDWVANDEFGLRNEWFELRRTTYVSRPLPDGSHGHRDWGTVDSMGQSYGLVDLEWNWLSACLCRRFDSRHRGLSSLGYSERRLVRQRQFHGKDKVFS